MPLDGYKQANDRLTMCINITRMVETKETANQKYLNPLKGAEKIKNEEELISMTIISCFVQKFDVKMKR